MFDKFFQALHDDESLTEAFEDLFHNYKPSMDMLDVLDDEVSTKSNDYMDVVNDAFNKREFEIIVKGLETYNDTPNFFNNLFIETSTTLKLLDDSGKCIYVLTFLYGLYVKYPVLRSTNFTYYLNMSLFDESERVHMGCMLYDMEKRMNTPELKRALIDYATDCYILTALLSDIARAQGILSVPKREELINSDITDLSAPTLYAASLYWDDSIQSIKNLSIKKVLVF